MKNIVYLSILLATLIVAILSCSDDKTVSEFSNENLIEELARRRIPDVQVDGYKGNVRSIDIISMKGSEWDASLTNVKGGYPYSNVRLRYNTDGYRTVSSYGCYLVKAVDLVPGKPSSLKVTEMEYAPVKNVTQEFDNRNRVIVRDSIEYLTSFQIKDVAGKVVSMGEGYRVDEVLDFAGSEFTTESVGALNVQVTKFKRQSYYYNDVAKLGTVIHATSSDKGATFVESLKRVHPLDSLGLVVEGTYDEYKITQASTETAPSTRVETVETKNDVGNPILRYVKSTSIDGTVTILEHKIYKY